MAGVSREVPNQSECCVCWETGGTESSNTTSVRPIHPRHSETTAVHVACEACMKEIIERFGECPLCKIPLVPNNRGSEVSNNMLQTSRRNTVNARALRVNPNIQEEWVSVGEQQATPPLQRFMQNALTRAQETLAQMGSCWNHRSEPVLRNPNVQNPDSPEAFTVYWNAAQRINSGHSYRQAVGQQEGLLSPGLRSNLRTLERVNQNLVARPTHHSISG